MNTNYASHMRDYNAVNIISIIISIIISSTQNDRWRTLYLASALSVLETQQCKLLGFFCYNHDRCVESNIPVLNTNHNMKSMYASAPLRFHHLITNTKYIFIYNLFGIQHSIYDTRTVIPNSIIVIIIII